MTKFTPAVIAFFSLNPDEELTINDIILKWGVANRHSVRRALLPYKGWINSSKKPDPLRKTKAVLFYCAGPLLLKEVQPNANKGSANA